MKQTLLQLGSFGIVVATVLSLVLFVEIPQPKKVSAFTTETPYGGLRFLTIPCTCAENDLVVLFDFASNKSLFLLYEPGDSILYAYYDIWKSTFLLGTYISVASECLIEAGYECVEIDADGYMGMAPGTGTSP